MASDGVLKRVLTKQQRHKPKAGTGITIGKDAKAQTDIARLKPDELRPVIAEHVEQFLKSGGKIQQIPAGVGKFNGDND